MRAMVLEDYGQPLILRDLPIPEPGPGEVLAKTEACGICGTELKISAGNLPGTCVPLVMGHEPAGTVVRVGPGGRLVIIG